MFEQLTPSKKVRDKIGSGETGGRDSVGAEINEEEVVAEEEGAKGK